MLGKTQKIEELKSDLEVREVEIERLKEAYAKEIEALKQQHAQECEVIRTEVRELNETLEATNRELSATRIELNKMRSNAQGLSTYRTYNKRLLPPVTPEEMAKAYPGFSLTVTPAFFRLGDEHGISWLIERAGYLRRYTGYVANLFNTPDYTPLREDSYFQGALPNGIKSNLEIVFVEQRESKVFRLCPPSTATSVAVTFLVEQTAELQTWHNEHEKLIVVNANCKRHPDLRQISIALPFPVGVPNLQVNLELDGKDCTPADLEHLRKSYDSQLRDACHHIYMRNFFLDATYFSTRYGEDTEQKEKDT